jgi:hypothetical protein
VGIAAVYTVVYGLDVQGETCFGQVIAMIGNRFLRLY